MSASPSRFAYPLATLRQLAQDVLDYARTRGATACEVDVSEGFGYSVGVRCGEVETVSEQEYAKLTRINDTGLALPSTTLADLVADGMAQDTFCVFGNEVKLQENQSIFKRLKNVMG